jgi:drug/metabolite transporter (DMT)-like permease
MFLIPVVMYPANYYCHYVFLLPLVAASKRDESNKMFGWLAFVSCAMSVALYQTLSERLVDVLYTQQSAVLLGGLLLMMAPLAWFALKDKNVTAETVALALDSGDDREEKPEEAAPVEPAAPQDEQGAATVAS